MSAQAEPGLGARRVRLGAVVAIAVAVGFGAWLLLKDDGGGSSERAASRPSEASVSDLEALANSLGHPIYWAGGRPGARYELTRTADENVYVRYLSPSAELGVPRPNYLTVGTYPFRRAVAALRRLARPKRAVSAQLERGGIAVAGKRESTNAYFAYPGEGVQVEVFDPRPGRALRLVTSGRIVPVD